MADRVTDKMLENLLAIINKEMGTPETKWTHHEDQRVTANEGHYGLYQCLGVCSMVQIVGEGGGERTIIQASNKRECYAKMQVWRAGVRVAREAMKKGN